MKEVEEHIIDIENIRGDFPILHREVNGRPLVYLDNAASSQKPQQVIDAISDYYSNYNANIHRGVHHLAALATEAYENSRKFITEFIGAAAKEEIIFTAGTTDGLNLLAYTLGRSTLKEGDEILITEMEHHSNIVPWQLACEYTGAKLKVVPMSDEGALDLQAYENLLSERTKIVSLVHVSNSLGTINPVKEMIVLAKAVGAKTVIDGAQSVPHKKVNMQDLDCDFFVFSGHKTCGPTGSGILYGKEKELEQLPPFRGGGEMIETVSFEKTTYNSLPYKFEAGTPHIEGGIVLGTALRYMDEIGMQKIADYEHNLHQYQEEQLLSIDGLHFYGKAANKASLSSFLVDGVHPYDLGALLDQMGIAVRTGHHCTQPIMDRYGIPGTVRSSLAFYNNREDVDRLVEGIKKAVAMLR
jgi:cysteine desulfurase/selenocysteine lyase